MNAGDGSGIYSALAAAGTGERSGSSGTITRRSPLWYTQHHPTLSLKQASEDKARQWTRIPQHIDTWSEKPSEIKGTLIVTR